MLELWLELVLSSTVEIIKITPRRRWSVGEKVRLIEASMAPGQSISLVVRAYGVAPMGEGGKTSMKPMTRLSALPKYRH